MIKNKGENVVLKTQFLQYNNMQNLHINSDISLNILSSNESYLKLENGVEKNRYSFEDINSFLFQKMVFIFYLN